VTLTAPDSFAPVVGDQIYVDHLKPPSEDESAPREGGEIGVMNLTVCGVEWRLRIAGGHVLDARLGEQPQYELVMCVTLTCDPPSTPAARGPRRAQKK
jgi:hypothetical protein